MAAMVARHCLLAIALVLIASGCAQIREIAGLPVQNDPSVALKSAETRWLLIQNPRFGDVPSEPEYIWVEEDKVPTTLKTVFRGKGAIIARPEIVAKYGAPPGGGKISPRQGVPYQANADPKSAAGQPSATGARTVSAAATPAALAAPRAPEPKRGYVVYVDTTRIVIDLTAADGLHSGSVVSLRRDRIPIMHPVTGEMLGELDEEVGTARVTETRDRFSVAEIQAVAPGSQIQVRDRVLLK
jgi:hypothetical protein